MSMRSAIDLFKQSFNSARQFKVVNDPLIAPAALIYFNIVNNETTTTTATVLEEKTVDITDTTGAVDGAYIGIFSLETNRFYQGHIVGDPVGNTVTLDNPFDSVLPIGSTFGIGTEHMNVDGSGSPVIFGLRGADPGINITLDVKILTIMMETTSAVDMNRFGNIVGGLTHGLVMRGVDGFTLNFGNIKTNADMVTWGATIKEYDASNPSHGIYGISAVFDFAQLGIALRVGPDESLNIWVQDLITLAEGIVDLRISAFANIAIP